MAQQHGGRDQTRHEEAAGGAQGVAAGHGDAGAGNLARLGDAEGSGSQGDPDARDCPALPRCAEYVFMGSAVRPKTSEVSKTSEVFRRFGLGPKTREPTGGAT